jgi:probable F420-dependent oxidoreductase
MTSARIGIDLTDWLSIRERVALAGWAEEQGFDAAYAPEVADPDAFVVSALALTATSRIRLATGIIQIGPRSVPMIASSTASVENLAPGRFALGIGVSSEAIVSGWHGLSYEHPLGRARESVDLLRLLLAGETSAGLGEHVTSRGYRLGTPPITAPPIHLAGLNQKMLELAGAVADGAWLNFLPIGRAAAVTELVRESAAGNGRPEPELLLSLPCDVTDDPGASRAQLRRLLRFYMAAPAYRRAMAWHGFEQEMEDVADGIAAGDRGKVLQALTDELIDSVSLIGDASYCRERLAMYLDAGITSPCLSAIDSSRIATSLAELSARRIGVGGA